ncbi:alpha/beta hydrolase family protein [Thermodesulfobacteriota bacterium]
MILKNLEKSLKWYILAAVILCLCPSGLMAGESCRIVNGSFADDSRNRVVPFRVYFPNQLQEKYPVVIFSHGLGGSRNTAAYLGRYLAENNYLAFHIQHPGSDSSLWQNSGSKDIMGTMEASLRNPRNAINRFQDVPFVLDQLKKLDVSDSTFKGHLDLEKIGMAGHSYGARSTMFAAGERIGRGYRSFKDSRIRAGVILSPKLPRRNVDLERAYQDIDIPLFHITGTRDGSPLPSSRNMDPAQRTKPYQYIENNIPQYLLVLHQADHMTFSGRRLDTPAETEDDQRHIAAVQKGVLAFYDGYVKGDSEALKWLRKGFVKTLHKADRFEWKPHTNDP